MAVTITAMQDGVDTIGERESLSDLIYNISPTETPFLMMAGRGTASATKEEWQMDQLAVHAQNASHEGLKVATADALIPTERVANYTQISDKTVSISGTLEVVNKAGRSSELSYQLAKRAKELKRDIEFGCCGHSDIYNVGAAVTTPRVSSPVANFGHTHFDGQTATGALVLPGLHTSLNGGNLGGWDNVGFDVKDNGTQRALLESTLKGVIQGAWTNGGDPSVIMCGPFNKTVISGFTGNSTRFDRGEDKRLVAAIDVYVSDFGEHRAVPNRFMKSRDVYCLTPELWEVAYLRSFRQHALAKVGDAEERTLLAEWTLKGLNQAGNGFIYDLTTA